MDEADGSEQDQSNLVVVAMGVGTKFLSEKLLRQETTQSSSYGTRVRDCHAEVLARRAFRRYLSCVILQDLRNSEQPSKTFQILQRFTVDDTKTRYMLRPNVVLHFYCSSAPCGNAVLKKFATMKKEKFREDLGPDEWPNDRHDHIPPHSISLGQFALLVKKDNSSYPDDKRTCLDTKLSNAAGLTKKQTNWPAVRSDDWCPPGTTTVWTSKGSLHTCSDKLARWNYLGLQGSLLASIIDNPVFCKTLTVGRKLTAITCQRAVCCRLGKDDDCDDQKNYLVNHPAIMGTSVCMDKNAVIDMTKERETGQDVRFHSTLSWAWWLDDNDAKSTLECVDGGTGLAFQDTDAALQTLASPHVPIPGVASRRSLVSTAALVELFADIERQLLDTSAAASWKAGTHSLESLVSLKKSISPSYEAKKLDFYTKHHVMRNWIRRRRHASDAVHVS